MRGRSFYHGYRKSVWQQQTENALAAQSLQDTSLATLSTVKSIEQRVQRIEEASIQSIPSIENAEHIPAWLQRTINSTIAQTVEQHHLVLRNVCPLSVKSDESPRDEVLWNNTDSQEHLGWQLKDNQSRMESSSDLNRKKRSVTKIYTDSNYTWHTCWFGRLLLQTTKTIIVTEEGDYSTACNTRHIRASIYPAKIGFSEGLRP